MIDLQKPVPAWRVYLYTLGGIGAGVLIGMMIGSFDHEHEVSEQLETHDRISRAEEKKTKRAVETRIVVTPVLLNAPDGGVVLASMKTIERRENAESDSKVNAESTSDLKRVITFERPQWRAGILGGARFAPSGVTGLAGGFVERRIAGPFSVMGQAALELDPRLPQPVVGGQVIVAPSIEW